MRPETSLGVEAVARVLPGVPGSDPVGLALPSFTLVAGETSLHLPEPEAGPAAVAKNAVLELVSVDSEKGV